MGETKLNIGHKVKLLREMRGISQEALAVDMGISQQAVHQIENGKIKVALDRAQCIARSLNLELDDLLSFQPAQYLSIFTKKEGQEAKGPLSEQLVEQINKQHDTLKIQLEYLQLQNSKLLEILASERKNPM